MNGEFGKGRFHKGVFFFHEMGEGGRRRGRVKEGIFHREKFPIWEIPKQSKA